MMPKIIRLDLRKARGLHGGYSRKTGKIYLEKSLKPKKFREVLAHELVHYREHQLGNLKRGAPRIIKELKRGGLYPKLTKRYVKEWKYKPKELLTEYFADFYKAMKKREISKRRLIKFKRKYPFTSRTFLRLSRKIGR